MPTIQIKRGAAAGLPTLASGEPGWTTDTKQLWIGDGSTNHLIGPSALSDGDKGDITVSSSGTVLTIDSGVVTFAKMQTVSTDVLLGNDGSGSTVQEITCTAAGRAILDDADAAAQRVTLGLEIGVNVQAYDAILADIAALSDPGAGRLLFWDDTAGAVTWLTAGSGLSISGTTITATVGVSDLPAFTGLAAGAVTFTDELPEYNSTDAANRKITVANLTGYADPGICEGRLTLISGDAYPTSNVSSGTLYFTPIAGARVALYDNTRWQRYQFTERSLSLTITSGKNYDVFLYDNSGTLTLELSAAWTNDTTRANALAVQDNVLVKSGATTRRYLGTIRAVSTNTTQDTETRRFVWNYYNRARRKLKVIESTDSWTYTSGTLRQVRASSNNQVEIVVGWAGQLVHLRASLNASQDMVPAVSSTAIGVDSTSTGTTDTASRNAGVTANVAMMSEASLIHAPTIGYHYYAWLEAAYGAGGVTSTHYGDGGGTGVTFQSGMDGETEA